MPLTDLLILLATGAGAGFLGALLGVGGGIIIVPAAVLLLGLPIHHAIATSLLAVIATSSAAVPKNVRTGLANIPLGVSLEIGTVLGALVGSMIAGMLEIATLELVFGLAMALLAFPMALRVDETRVHVTSDGSAHRLDGHYVDGATGAEVRYHVRRLPVALGVSSIAGVLSGLLGVGGGIIKVPLMTLACGVPMKAAAATSNFMIGVTALASALVFYSRGQVEPVPTAALVLGVFAGSRFGARVLGATHTRSLRRIFAVVMIIVGVQMVLQSQGVRLT